eukprot:1986245-Amphidinium_carterae.2
MKVPPDASSKSDAVQSLVRSTSQRLFSSSKTLHRRRKLFVKGRSPYLALRSEAFCSCVKAFSLRNSISLKVVECDSRLFACSQCRRDSVGHEEQLNRTKLLHSCACRL